MSDDFQAETGAVRSSDADLLRFDLIHPVAMIALARTAAEGAVKYGDANWEQGFPAWNLINHALRHIYLFLAGDRSEPHLPHAAWGLLAAIVSDTLWPELNQDTLRGPGCVLTPEHQARMAAERPTKAAFRRSPDGALAGSWRLADLAETRTILAQRESRENS